MERAVLDTVATRFMRGCDAFSHARLTDKFVCSVWAEVARGPELLRLNVALHSLGHNVSV